MVSIKSRIEDLYLYLRKNNRNMNIMIIFSFLIFSFLSVVLLLHNGMLYGSSDAQFHALRIQEIYKSISAGNLLPQFNLSTFGSDGVATLALYPYLNLYPMAILMYFIKNAALLYYLFFMSNIFISMLICFYSSLKFSKSYYVSYLLAVSYSLSMNFFGVFFNSGDLGVFSAMAVLPLIIFGTFSLIKYNRWIELSIGMTLTLYFHVLSFILATIIVFMFLLINIRHFKIKSLIPPILLTMSLGALFWTTFLKIFLLNSINNPNDKLGVINNSFDPQTKEQLYNNHLASNVLFSGTKFTDLLQGMTSEFQQGIGTQFTTLGIISLVAIILGIICYKKMNRMDKQFYFVSIGMIMLASSLFPWYLFNNNNIISTIQFSWRLYVIPAFLLSYVFSKLVVKGFNYRTFARFITVFTLIVLFLVINQISYQATEINSQGNNDIKNTILKTSRISGNFDYIPIPALKNYNDIMSDKATYQINNNNKSIYLKSGDNGQFSFNIEDDVNVLTLPFVTYNGIDYDVKLDNKLVPFGSLNQTMIIYKISKGEHSLQIIPKNTIFNFISFIITIPGLIILFLSMFMRNNELESMVSKWI